MTANRIIHHIFNQPDLRNVDQASLERLVETYPYFAAARVLLAQKQFSYIPDYNTPVFKKAQLYTSTPQYLHQLTMMASAPAPAAVPAPETDIVAKLEAEAGSSLAGSASSDPDALMENVVAEEAPLQVLSALTAEQEQVLEDEVSAEDQAILDALEAEDRAAADAKTKAEEEAAAKAAAEAETQRLAEEEAKRIAEEVAAAKAAAEAELIRLAEEEAAKAAAEEEAKRIAEEAAAAEAEAKRIAEEVAAAKAAAEAELVRIAEEEAAKAAAEEEAKRIAEEVAAAKAAAEAELVRIAEEEAAKAAAEEEAKRIAEEAAAAEAEAKRVAEEVAAAKAAAEAELVRIAEEEAAKAERDEIVAVDYEAVEAEIARTSTEDEIVAVDYEAVEAEIARTSTEDEIVAVDYEAVEAEIARTSTEDEIVAVDYEAIRPETPQQYEPEIEEEEIVVPSGTSHEGPGLAIPKADPETPLVKVAADEEEDEETPAATEEAPIRIHPMDKPVQETELTFQPLYTEDYFAYKKLKDPITAEKMTEKAAAEMRSFTDWLRELKDNFSGKSARDWYHQQLNKLYEDDDPEVSERVEKMAIQSITLNDDIVSETLAEIWVRQHQPEKAITIYQKLSLLNPGKNAYFAQRINELKQQLSDNNK